MGSCLSRRKQAFDPSRDLLDLKGKVVLVTGANTGIGYETVKHLARRGAKVYLGARNELRATGALARLEHELQVHEGLGHPQGSSSSYGEVIWLKADFSDLRSAKTAAEDFLKREQRLDVLVNNAAQLTGPFEMTADGISTLMTVNHFGPFVFTRTLLPLLIKTSKEPASDVRIVTLSSIAHRNSRAADPGVKFRDIEDFNGVFQTDVFPDWSRYSLTKLANVLWSRELQKLLDAAGEDITCIAVDPGQVNTFASRMPFPWAAAVVFKLFFDVPEVGAYNSCFAAASPDIARDRSAKWKGAYLEPVGLIAEPSKAASSDALAKELWETTERILEDLRIV